MSIPEKLIPDLAQWNFGRGISPSDWIFAEGRADHALGFCALLWPQIGSFESYVLREPINIEHLRGWEKVGRERQEIETAMNACFLEGIFPSDNTDPKLKDAQLAHLAQIMTHMLAAKLAVAFPDKRFSTCVIDDGDDFAVSFYQT